MASFFTANGHFISSDIFIEEGATHSFEVLCPRCGVAKQGAGHWLYKPDRKCHLHCIACQRYPSARLWLCPCKVPWISCHHHRGLGFRCRGNDMVRDMKRPKKMNPSRDFWERRRQRLRPASGTQPFDTPHAPTRGELTSMHAPRDAVIHARGNMSHKVQRESSVPACAPTEGNRSHNMHSVSMQPRQSMQISQALRTPKRARASTDLVPPKKAFCRGVSRPTCPLLALSASHLHVDSVASKVLHKNNSTAASPTALLALS